MDSWIWVLIVMAVLAVIVVLLMALRGSRRRGSVLATGTKRRGPA